MLGSKSASSANGKGELGTSQAASDRFRTPLGVRSIASDQSTDQQVASRHRLARLSCAHAPDPSILALDRGPNHPGRLKGERSLTSASAPTKNGRTVRDASKRPGRNRGTLQHNISVV